jgi:hypothetical protein
LSALVPLRPEVIVYVPARIEQVLVEAEYRIAVWQRPSVAKGPSVPLAFGAGSSPDQLSFPFAETMKVLVGAADAQVVCTGTANKATAPQMKYIFECNTFNILMALAQVNSGTFFIVDNLGS